MFRGGPGHLGFLASVRSYYDEGHWTAQASVPACAGSVAPATGRCPPTSLRCAATVCGWTSSPSRSRSQTGIRFMSPTVSRSSSLPGASSFPRPEMRQVRPSECATRTLARCVIAAQRAIGSSTNKSWPNSGHPDRRVPYPQPPHGHARPGWLGHATSSNAAWPDFLRHRCGRRRSGDATLEEHFVQTTTRQVEPVPWQAGAGLAAGHSFEGMLLGYAHELRIIMNRRDFVVF